ncbi:MAG: secondary thiamine-phosphate synthase enzyme YjbQ [bacterium]|nr:secondary thiamine-phosphate synthase enzyme YjbQ [bacterium]
MKSYTEYLWFNTDKRKCLINITNKVKEAINKSGVKEGFCLISAMHITAGIWVNDEEEGIKQDLFELLEKLAPYKKDYKHHLTGEDNADAHLKRTLINHQAIIPITNYQADLGPWEQIFYAEFDGQRRKRVIIKIIGE